MVHGEVTDAGGVLDQGADLARAARESGRDAQARAHARRALKDARGLPYETALARFVLGASGGLSALLRLGLRREKVLRWKDIP